MTTPASAHPRLSPSGRRVVAGEHVIVVDSLIEVGPGTSAQWADEERLYYIRQPDGAFVTTIVGSGKVDVVRDAGFNHFSALGVDHWAGYRAGTGVVFSNGARVAALSDPALSTDRAVWAARVIAGGALDTESGRPRKYADRDCSEIRYARQALAWLTFVDGRRQVAGRRHQLETPTLLTLDSAGEGWPVPFFVGDALWLLTLCAARLLLRPWGEPHGYVVATDVTFDPDAAALPDGRIRIVWDAGGNVLGERVIDPREPRLDLRGPIVVTPPQPPVNPPDPKPDPKEPTVADVVPNRIDAVEAAKNRYPAEWALAHKDYPQDGSRTTRAQAERYIRLLAYDLNREDPRFGLNGKRGNTNDLSQDALCFQHNDGFESVIDVIGGAGGDHPAPTWNVVGDHLPPGAPRQAWIQPQPVSDSVPTNSPSRPPTQPPASVNLQPVIERLDALLARPVADVSVLAALADRLSGVEAGIDEVQQRQSRFAAEHNDLLRAAAARPVAPRCNFPRFATATDGSAAGIAAAEPEDERSRASRLLDILESLLPFIRVLAGRD